jgi:hypothetical protein
LCEGGTIDPVPGTERWISSTQLALLATCKQVHKEAAPVFWKLNKFLVTIPDGSHWETEYAPSDQISTLQMLIAHLGPQKASWLTNVSFAQGTFSIDFLADPAMRERTLEEFRLLKPWEKAYPHWHLRGIMLLKLWTYSDPFDESGAIPGPLDQEVAIELRRPRESAEEAVAVLVKRDEQQGEDVKIRETDLEGLCKLLRDIGDELA